MPRYFFDVFNEFDSHDDEGIELPDLQAVRHQVRRTLPALLQEIKTSQDAAQFRVDVRDTGGRRVVTSTILMLMQSSSGDEQPEKALTLAAREVNLRE